MKLTGSKAIVECLKKEGVRTAFGILGGAILPLYDALYDETNIRHVLVRHEQGAAHAAEGFARASGDAGVCISTSGPGATNLLTGIADAYADSVPVVALSGQVPTHLIGNDAFQEADMFGLTMPITKHNYKILDAADIPQVFKSAFYIARSGRQGPVHIDLPKDVQNAEIDFEYPKAVALTGYQPRSEGHPMQVKRALQMLLEAERPAILAGGGVISANASQELVRLAEALLCPVTTTLLGKGCISEYHPLALGMAGMHGRKCANYALSNCDVLLAVGTRFSDRITGDLRHFASGAKIVHVDVDPSEISKNVPAYLPIVGDAKKVLAAMLAELHAQAAKGRENEWRKRMRELREACECDIGYDETPVKPQRAMKELMDALPEQAIAVTEVGRHQMWAAHFYRAREPRGFISSGGLGTMGFGLPAAIGAKAAMPERCVVDIAGDGSLLMVNQEFATSVEHALPVIVYLLHDNWLGMVRQWQKLFYAKRYSATNLGTTPDFVKLAKAYGCEGERVAKPGELKQALKNALKSDVTYLVDIAVDAEEDVLPMVPPGGRLDQMVGLEKCRPIPAQEKLAATKKDSQR